jgi:hypothetical protein
LALLLLAMLLQDGLPGDSAARAALRRVCAPLLYPLGLWQNDWRLFAPDPDRVNARIEARVTLSDGRIARVTSPDWRHLAWTDAALQGRLAKWWDYLRRDEYRPLFPALARYMASRAAWAPARPIKVELIRHWWDVPAPDAEGPVAEPIAPPAEFPYHHPYHTEHLP